MFNINPPSTLVSSSKRSKFSFSQTVLSFFSRNFSYAARYQKFWDFGHLTERSWWTWWNQPFVSIQAMNSTKAYNTLFNRKCGENSKLSEADKPILIIFWQSWPNQQSVIIVSSQPLVRPCKADTYTPIIMSFILVLIILSSWTPPRETNEIKLNSKDSWL